MIRIEVSTEINRPVQEVFEYMADQTKVPEWNSSVEESTPSETPIRVGTKMTQRARFLGRKLESVAVVTEFVPNQRFALKIDKPFQVTITNRFEAAGGGTKMTAVAEGELAGFFKLGDPIIARLAKKRIEADLDVLKELVEARSPAEAR